MNKINRAYLKGLIAADRLDDLIEKLLQLLSNYPSSKEDNRVLENYDAVILISSKLKSTRNENVLGIIDSKDAKLAISQIGYSLLSIINSIPESVFEHQSAEASEKNEALPQKTTEIKRLNPVFRAIHPLQPATYFCGRQDLLQDFTHWWNDPLSADRVRALIAIGGTGKTALIEHFLNSCIDKQKLQGSVLVWSFYEDPNTDAFLEEALRIFAGEESGEQGIGGRLGRLQHALATGEQAHLLVLDGLERIQSEGKGDGRAWGELEDHRLKNLLRSIAAGLGKTRAIITSRFKLSDLAQWEHRGYQGIELDTLDAQGALNLLRAWQVKGTDATLQALAESLGRHALSVSVLGSYLKNYCKGDPAAAAEFQLEDSGRDDSQAAKLARILTGYAQNLSADERDLLIRMSIFPRGISVEILGYLIAAGGEIAGTLVGFNEVKLLRLANRLHKLGLVYTYHLRNSLTYTAHPFLRDYFRKLLSLPPEKIHEAVRDKLALGLDSKPDNKPQDTQMLDKYEALIEQTILSGRFVEACDLYYNVMGGGGANNHLYHTLGDYGRIIRILSQFSENGQPETLGQGLKVGDSGYLINGWGLAALALGDLTLAGRCFELASELARKDKDWNNLSAGLQNSAWVCMYQGIFISAKKLLQEALEHGEEEDKFVKKGNYGYLAATCHTLGEIQEAQDNFKIAAKLEGEPLYATDGIFQAEYLFNLGQKEQAIQLTQNNLAKAEKNGWQRFISLSHTILGLFFLPDSIIQARQHLGKARQWPELSGEMECIIRNHHLAAEIALCSGDMQAGLGEATTGLNQAESCGYGRFAIELLLQLARIHLAIPDPAAALTYARRALDWSSRAEVRYAWGIAAAAELCGSCHRELGEYELAARHFEEAEGLRATLRL